MRASTEARCGAILIRTTACTRQAAARALCTSAKPFSALPGAVLTAVLRVTWSICGTAWSLSSLGLLQTCRPPLLLTDHHAGLDNTQYQKRWCAVYEMRLFYYTSSQALKAQGFVSASFSTQGIVLRAFADLGPDGGPGTD
jgi:hypothetical protein